MIIYLSFIDIMVTCVQVVALSRLVMEYQDEFRSVASRLVQEDRRSYVLMDIDIIIISYQRYLYYS